jgi:hypothetical protein
MSRSTFGVQPQSRHANAPVHRFPGATRDQVSKIFLAQVEGDEPEKKRHDPFDHNPPKIVPTPGARPGFSITFSTLRQLEETGRTELRRKARALQDALGENVPKLPSTQPELILWILHAQVILPTQ